MIAVFVVLLENITRSNNVLQMNTVSVECGVGPRRHQGPHLQIGPKCRRLRPRSIWDCHGATVGKAQTWREQPMLPETFGKHARPMFPKANPGEPRNCPTFSNNCAKRDSAKFRPQLSDSMWAEFDHKMAQFMNWSGRSPANPPSNSKRNGPELTLKTLRPSRSPSRRSPRRSPSCGSPCNGRCCHRRSSCTAPLWASRSP